MSAGPSSPPNPEVADAWAQLETHLAWTEGPWVGFVFTPSTAQARWLEERAHDVLSGRDRVLRPRTPQDLRELLPRLLEPRPQPAALTWVEAVHTDAAGLPGAAPGPWTEAWDWLMLRANERRGPLLGRIGGGLVFVAPPVFKPRFRQAAPDLWSIRALVLEIEAPALAADQDPPDGPPTLDELVAELLLRVQFHLDTHPPGWLALILGGPAEREALRQRILGHLDPERVRWVDVSDRLSLETQLRTGSPEATVLAGPPELRSWGLVEAERVAFSVDLAAHRPLPLGDQVRLAREAVYEARELGRRLPSLRGEEARRVTAGRLEALTRAVEALLRQGWVGEAAPLAQELTARARTWSGRSRERRRRGVLAQALELEGQIARLQGDLPRATELLEEALALREGLTRARGRERHRRLGDVARCRAVLAELLRERGDEDEAVRQLEQVRDLRRQLAARSGDMEAQGDLALTLSVLGELFAARGALQRAREHLEDALEIRERLAGEVGALRFLRGCSVSWSRLADILWKQEDRPGALAARERALELARRLVSADPGNATWRMEATIAEGHLADLLAQNGEQEEASQRWGRILQDRLALAEQDPENARWQQYVAVAYGRSAELARALDRLEVAERQAERAVERSERLARDNPHAVAWQHGLAVACKRLGDMRALRGDVQGAEEAWSRARQTAEHLQTLGDGGQRRAASLLDGLRSCAISRGDDLKHSRR